MKLKSHATFFFICALFASASTSPAQTYEFQFETRAPGFGGELFFNVPSGSVAAGDFLEGNSFITTPDGTFTLSESFIGGPLFDPPLPTVWSPSGITALSLNEYEIVDSQLYNWTASPTTIADSPAGAIPLVDPSAIGTWVYIGAVPEPGVIPLAVLGAAAMLLWRIRRN